MDPYPACMESDIPRGDVSSQSVFSVHGSCLGASLFTLCNGRQTSMAVVDWCYCYHTVNGSGVYFPMLYALRGLRMPWNKTFGPLMFVFLVLVVRGRPMLVRGLVECVLLSLAICVRFLSPLLASNHWGAYALTNPNSGYKFQLSTPAEKTYARILKIGFRSMWNQLDPVIIAGGVGDRPERPSLRLVVEVCPYMSESLHSIRRPHPHRRRFRENPSISGKIFQIPPSNPPPSLNS